MEIENNPSKTPLSIPNKNILKLLCILTILWSSLSFISFFFIGIIYDYFKQNLNIFVVDEQQKEVIKLWLRGGKGFFLCFGLLNASTFIGAIQMWKLKKIGFHIYSVSKLLLLIIPFIFISNFPSSLGSMFSTLAFILLYRSFYKQMK